MLGATTRSPPRPTRHTPEALEAAGIPVEIKELTRMPSSTVEVDDDTAKSILKLLEQLEDHDDVQSVASNVQLSPAQLEAASQ